MTTEQSPVTILGDLIEQLESDIDCYKISTSEGLARAYAAGADQELDACRIWVSENCDIYSAVELIQFRRPKPPSLKEQALKALDEAVYMADDIPPEGISADQADIIRRALESLPD